MGGADRIEQGPSSGARQRARAGALAALRGDQGRGAGALARAAAARERGEVFRRAVEEVSAGPGSEREGAGRSPARLKRVGAVSGSRVGNPLTPTLSPAGRGSPPNLWHQVPVSLI